jgi:CheY-like chemotaxis protein
MLNKKNRLLVVDDDNINMFIVRKIIEKSGFEIDLVFKNNGLQALDYLKNLISTGKALPNLMLTDINMPLMDGWELIDNCLNLNILGQTNTYVLSSSVYEEDLEKIKMYPDLKGFISKPLSFEILGRLMQEISV